MCFEGIIKLLFVALFLPRKQPTTYLHMGTNENTGKSLSEALLFAEHGENMLCAKICSKCQKQFLYTTCSPQVSACIFHVLNL